MGLSCVNITSPTKLFWGTIWNNIEMFILDQAMIPFLCYLWHPYPR